MHSIFMSMDLPKSADELERDLAATRDELAELDRRDAQLESAMDEIEHDMRRSHDALVRSGFRSNEAQSRSDLLEKSREAIVDDRDRIHARRVQLTERLATIAKRLDEGGLDD